jgi:hypothetical protein
MGNESMTTPSATASVPLWSFDAWMRYGTVADAALAATQQIIDYTEDFWQRTILFLDILRQRGNQHYEHVAQEAPNVLSFRFRVLMKGWEFERPVNYALVEIIPESDAEPDPKKRPFIVFDPRAGHGPGIGGMKHDSEIGVALKAGHPCYFVGFMPEPVAGQTVEDVCRAEVHFVHEVIRRHPEADGKPCLIGNCQAGWQIMMMSAIEPDSVGPIMLAGSPLSYWNGVHGKNPLRYLGGLLGGTWLTSLAGDLGHGLFDGAYLVSNFEALNPANTYWEKSYNVFSKVDTEGPRFLEFEKWWGSPVLLNAIEMQAIADDLFVGNKLSTGGIYTSEGMRVDLRNIKSPIIVFCSFGDNITPPQQALGWILDLYDDDDELRTYGQTIIYSLHQNIGHLGIFVSAKVATKEHQELTQSMDLIDALPPGLYEAVITEKDAAMAGADLVAGRYLIRFLPRTLDDLRALGGNDHQDDLRFATVARISAINQGIYRNYVSPFVRAVTSDKSAEWLQSLHPYRLRYQIFSDKNLFMHPFSFLADEIREHRHAISEDNPLLLLQHEISRWHVAALDRYQLVRDQLIEDWFMTIYGSPMLQSLVGLQADEATARQKIGREVVHRAATAEARAEIERGAERGGLREAAIRALLYIGLGKSELGADARGFSVLRQIRAKSPESQRMSLSTFKAIVREQFLQLRLNEERALAAIPKLLPDDPKACADMIENMRQVIVATGEPGNEVKERLRRIESLFRSSLSPERSGAKRALAATT